jgi:hypothetical protein
MAFRAMRDSTDVNEPELVNPRVWKMFKEVCPLQTEWASQACGVHTTCALQPSSGSAIPPHNICSAFAPSRREAMHLSQAVLHVADSCGTLNKALVPPLIFKSDHVALILCMATECGCLFEQAIEFKAHTVTPFQHELALLESSTICE